jgi:hypothetical protein
MRVYPPWDLPTNKHKHNNGSCLTFRNSIKQPLDLEKAKISTI